MAANRTGIDAHRDYLAACGGGGNNSNGQGGQKTTSPQKMRTRIKQQIPHSWQERSEYGIGTKRFWNEMIPEFNKVYPNITVEYTIVNPNDYLQKLQSGIASGSDVPDVILGEEAYRGQLFSLGVLDNLRRRAI